MSGMGADPLSSGPPIPAMALPVPHTSAVRGSAATYVRAGPAGIPSLANSELVHGKEHHGLHSITSVTVVTCVTAAKLLAGGAREGEELWQGKILSRIISVP